MNQVPPNVSCQGRCKGFAACCKFVMLPMRNLDHAAWAKLHGLKVFRIKGTDQLRALFPSPCAALTSDNLCGLYGKRERPLMCAEYDCEAIEYEEV